ncbi:MAG TPA: SUMF1/EgtB/PvdO family nonheme iron enzyme [Polyangiaceae bacterium]|nr:SUMF1/EgtB/PvdO family nonheme iron enzyme [Polyangiaceae bacterium]
MHSKKGVHFRSISHAPLVIAGFVLILGCRTPVEKANADSGAANGGVSIAGGTTGVRGGESTGGHGQGGSMNGDARGGDAGHGGEGGVGVVDRDSGAGGFDAGVGGTMGSDFGGMSGSTSSAAGSGGEPGSGDRDEGGIVDAGGDTADEGGVIDAAAGGSNSSDAAGQDAGGRGGTADDRSCADLTPTCGSSGNVSCCASPIVTGGTYARSNDATYPATVSDFRLDRYEVTVGRFRKFLSAYLQNMILAGSGKNPNDTNDPGWDSAWNASLPVDDSALRTAIGCSLTWTPTTGPNENYPMNCVDWYEANAFCIWDGGRLPSEAEWNYAAAGGSEQRLYPWGAAEPDCSYANYFGAAGPDYCVWVPGPNAISKVGSLSPKGDGKWGQADLAGNLQEWILDWYATPYAQVPCVDCANTAGTPPWCPYPDAPWCNEPALYRVIRGGDIAVTAPGLITSYRDYEQTFPTTRNNITGFRCARSVQ